MDEYFDMIFIIIVGGAIAWFISKRYSIGDSPDHRPWGNWNTTYNAPPVYPVSQPVFLYPFYKTADLQT